MEDSQAATSGPTTARVGAGGLVAMVVAHLVWDPTLTLLGVSRFGIAEEDSAFVRSLLRIHPGLWLGVKLVFVGGIATVWYRIGVHRSPVTAWVPWLAAIVGVAAPLGWLELFAGIA